MRLQVNPGVTPQPAKVLGNDGVLYTVVTVSGNQVVDVPESVAPPLIASGDFSPAWAV